jgi:hypothetical protein
MLNQGWYYQKSLGNRDIKPEELLRNLEAMKKFG